MKLKSAFFAAALAVSSLSAQAATFSFSQTGFAGGGSVTGSFSGVDLDLNGVLDASFNEISSFSLSFSGGALAPAFTLGEVDLAGLVYQLNSGNFIGDNGAQGAGEGISAFNSQHSYLSGVGLIGIKSLSNNGGEIGDGSLQTSFVFHPLTSTTSLISVSAVPETRSFAMMLAGLGLMGVVARRSRTK